MNQQEFAQHFDLAYLSPDLQKKDIDRGIEIANKYNISTMNVNPYWVEYANKKFENLNSKVRASAVIGFPYGANTLDIKMQEAKEMIKNGKIKIEINCGKIK